MFNKMIMLRLRYVLLSIFLLLLTACGNTNKKLKNDDHNTSDRIQKIIIATDGSGDYNCDGVSDEEQINQALKDISSSRGTVYLKAGTYKINAQIVIDKNTTTLEGEGKEITIIQLADEADWGEYNATYDIYSQP